jgi:hypothetical protein
MDKKIKKYSWIHELNAAAMKAKLLNEAQKYSNQQKFLAEEQQKLNEAKEAGLEGLVNFLKDVGVTIPQTRRNAAAFRGWGGMMDRSPDPDTASLGRTIRDVNPNNSDMNGDGEASALEVQADVETDGELDGNTDYENLGRMPTFNIPTQPTSIPQPAPSMPANLSQDQYTRLGMQQAAESGAIPASHMQRVERERLRALGTQAIKGAASRAAEEARKGGSLPSTVRQKAMQAGMRARDDFRQNVKLDRAANEMIGSSQGPRMSEEDLKKIAKILGEDYNSLKQRVNFFLNEDGADMRAKQREKKAMEDAGIDTSGETEEEQQPQQTSTDRSGMQQNVPPGKLSPEIDPNLTPEQQMQQDMDAASGTPQPQATTAPSAPMTDDQIWASNAQKIKKLREKQRNAKNDAKRAEAEKRLAAMNAYDESKMSDSMRARRAANRAKLQQEIENFSSGDDLTSDEAAELTRLSGQNIEISDKKRGASMGNRLKELSAKDPKTLTAQEASELVLLKISLSKPGTTRSAADAALGADADKVYGSTINAEMDDLVSASRTKLRQEEDAAREERKKRDAEWAEDARRARRDVVIKGTTMTYGEFEDQYGRPYDALNKEDSAMLSRAASVVSAARVSPTARAYDQTVVDFNRAYRDQNARMAGELGKADRRVDAAQMALDQFNADRKGTVQREISRIQAQPGFVQGVAQDMKTGIEDAKFRAESDKIRAEMAGEQGPPRSDAELSKMMRDARDASDQNVTQAAQSQTQKEAGKIADKVSSFTELNPVESETGEETSGLSSMMGLINQLPEPRPTSQQTANRFVDKVFMRQFQNPSRKSKVNLQSNLPTEARNSLDRYVYRRRA